VADSWVRLADAVQGIRAELDKAMSAGADQEVQFEVGPIELEFVVDVQKEAKGGIGVAVWVLSVTGKGGASRESTNRIKVVLNPKTSSGDQVQISSESGAEPPERSRADG
jgi:hypothetical protein